VSMSHDLRGSGCPEWLGSTRLGVGNRIPVVFNQPGQEDVESDCAPVAHIGGTDLHYGTPKDASAHACAATLRFHVKLHSMAWTQPVIGFYQRAAGRQIDHSCVVSRSDPYGDDAVILNALLTTSASPVACEKSHSGFHCLVRGWNFITRVLPVPPKIRTTY
jgi:hypothetical protein